MCEGRIIMKITSLLFYSTILLCSFLSINAQQLSSQQRSNAQRQLQTMSPEEIESKIKSLGMTREEAEKRAKENGIDLQSFLRGEDATVPSLTPMLESGPAGTEDTVSEVLPQKISRHKKIPTVDGLEYFGYKIFATTPSAFEPAASGPVDPEYLIGPEDVLRVSIWGQVEQQNELEVDKEGRIFIPTAGPVVVSGLTVAEANKILLKQLSRSFQGLIARPPTVWLDVTIAKIRPKRVFIMGEVDSPGGYTVNSYATVFNSLFAVGGPTVNGSLREVRLIRGNKIIAKVDLYSYLTGSDKNNDVRVQSNDIIFVPLRYNSIYVKGEVRRPGIYELLPGENLQKVLEYAGGLLPTSYVERVQIERIIPFKNRVKKEFAKEFIDLDFRATLTKNSDYTLADGDIITFYSILDEVKNYVTISGAVYKPGLYQLTPNMRLKDVIELADSLKPETYTVRGELIRTNPDNRTKISIPFDLRSSLVGNESANIFLQPKDEIIIHDIGISRILDEFVDIHGSVKKPGRYKLTQNMTLIDLLMLTNGYTEDASLLQAEISRIDRTKEDDTLAYIYFSNLPDLRDTNTINSFLYFERMRQNDWKLKHRDNVFIRPDPNFQVTQLVKITGEVKYPGEYALRTYNEYLSELIERAGGKTSAGYLRGGVLVRQKQRVNVDFENVMQKPKGDEDIILHTGDSIYIPKKPNAVRMEGQINNPGVLGFIEGDDLWDYIDRAGGLTDSAHFALLISPNGNVEKFSTGLFSGNAEVYDGSRIVVTKIPVPPPEKEGETIGQLIRDLFAITASALTIMVLARQL